MGRDPPPRSPVLAQHEEPPDACRSPSPAARDLARQAGLAVDRDERRLQVRDHERPSRELRNRPGRREPGGFLPGTRHAGTSRRRRQARSGGHLARRRAHSVARQPHTHAATGADRAAPNGGKRPTAVHPVPTGTLDVHGQRIDTAPHPCPSADQAIRDADRRGRDRLRRGARRIVRVPGTQRRRQDVRHADDRVRLAGLRWRALRPGHGSTDRWAADSGPVGGGAAAGHARPGADGLGQPRDLRPLLRPPAGRHPTSRGRAPRLRPAHRASARPGRAALRRDEATPDDRPEPDQRAGPAPARRADDGPRPTGPAPALGPALPAQAEGRDACASRPTTWTRRSSSAIGSW